MKYIYSFLLIILLIIVHNNNANAQKLAAKEFAQKAGADTTAIIVDVRTPQEFEQGHIKNAVNIDWNNAAFGAEADIQLPKNKTLYVYCRSGGRSAKATAQLRKMGFRVLELEGGILQWQKDELPVEKNQPTNNSPLNLNHYMQLAQSSPKVLIDFYADWCLPCQLMEPYLTKLEKSGKHHLKIIRIDIDQNPQLAADLKIASIPALHYYKDGDLMWGYVGYLSKRALLKKL
ncbi:MAG: rhodanese-like domain-containing protein [Niabella sp.]